VIGDGVIGLSVALEFGRRGATCRVLGASRPGSASGAAAGLLTPSTGRLSASVRPFYYGSLARFPAYVAALQEFDRELRLLEGLIEVTDTPEQRFAPPHAAPVALSPSEVAELEPSLGARAAVLHPRDGAIDNVRLLAALRVAARNQSGVAVADRPARRISWSRTGAEVQTEAGDQFSAATVVLAAGAWSGAIEGLPRALPVVPLKGQMVALRASPLSRPVMGAGVYLVPRGRETAVGATTERAGFDIATDSRAVATLRAAAIDLCPPLADAPLDRAWAGLRPATPDMLPILGPDPDQPGLVYACGHSKNGILLAPATAELIACLVTGEPTDLENHQFGIDRFAAEPAATDSL